MDDRLKQFRIGVMTLSAFLVAGILVVLFGKLPTFGAGSYQVKVVFDDAPGISANSPIKRSGKLVGRVAKVELLDDRTVLVTMTLDDDFHIYTDETVKISTSLLGDSELQVVRKKKPELPVAQPDNAFIQPNDVIKGQPATNPLNTLTNMEEDIRIAITSLRNTSDKNRPTVEYGQSNVDRKPDEHQQPV
ncbi:MAG: MlaD family protein [Pirellulales bacterium]